MSSFKNTIAMAALAIPAVQALGTAAVVNMCNFPAYVWSVADVASMMVVLPNQTIGYQEPYRNKVDGSGVSIKITPNYTPGGGIGGPNVTQFEYTLEAATGQVWYDLSEVNGNAFQGIPVLLQPSDTTCQNVTCASSDSKCLEAYNNPYDNFATHVCGAEADLFFMLCPPNNDGSSNPEPAASSSQPAPSSSSSSSSNDAYDVVIGSSGGDAYLETSAPAPATGSDTSSWTTTSPISSGSLGNLTSIGAFRGLVNSWVTFQDPSSSKRDAEPEAEAVPESAHAHRHFHEHISRRNRILGHKQ